MIKEKIISDIVRSQKEYFKLGETKKLSFRFNQLNKLRAAIVDNEKNILEALKKDLNKTEKDAYLTSVFPLLCEINFMIKNLKSFAKEKRVKTPFTWLTAKAYTICEPYGVALIISPWNYPFELSLRALIGSIATGNCAVLKPSEISENSSLVINEIIKKTFPQNYIAVVEDGAEEGQLLLEQKFDYILFSGSQKIGKIVMQSASRNLTPLTLELGGKSPCIVDEDVNINVAAKRIVWGKFLNSGQTCIAPDYLFVHKNIKNKFVEKLKKTITSFYGNDPLKNDSYGKIINQKHFDRLKNLLVGANIVFGGKVDEQSLKIEPTFVEQVKLGQVKLVDQVKYDDDLMQEEIFGPILPIFEYEELDDVINFINNRPKPLVLYFFSKDKIKQRKIEQKTSSGTVCFNDTIIQLSINGLPFGGVGESGFGKYHGKSSFDTFSHSKSVFRNSFFFDFLTKIRYPKFNISLKNLKIVLRFLGFGSF